MNVLFGKKLTWPLLLASALMLPSACTFEPGYGYGYDGGANVGIGVDYYEPLGFDYGGWGGNYRSGPPRGGFRGRGGGNHAYRSAPSSHGMPSIPMGSRGGHGSRGGGGHR